MAKKPRTLAASPRSRLKPPSKLGRKPPPENEDRRGRFERIGSKRMQNVVRQIQLLGNLCSPNYDCSADDLVLIRDTIHHELEMALARFTPRKRAAASNAFSFSDKPAPRVAGDGNTQH